MKILLCLSLLLSISPLHAETWSGTAKITFGGTSTLHAWGGKVGAEAFKADVTMSGGQPQRVKAEVTVKAANMDTAEPKRDANMLKAMKVDTHPLIVGKIDAKFSEIAAASTPTKLPIELNLLGKPQNVTGTISNWKLNGRKASFELDFPVSMKDSGISVPAVLLFIRVGDGVQVHASVTLTQN
jgi:polyisoprenoid-binding protein YceI